MERLLIRENRPIFFFQDIWAKFRIDVGMGLT